MEIHVFSDLFIEPHLSAEVPAQYSYSESYNFPTIDNAIVVFIFSDLYKNYSKDSSIQISRLVEEYCDSNSVLLLSDLQGNSILSDIANYDFSFGYYAQMPLSKVGVEKIAMEIKSFVRNKMRGAMKCYFVDLDNTLIPGVWEEEKESISDEYQKQSSGSFHSLKMFLKKQASYGAQVIVVSKNDHSSIVEALEFIDRSWNQWVTHIDSGWGVKHERISQIITRIRIAPQDCLVIDDNPIEIGSIEKYLPLINCQLFENNFQQFISDLKSKGLYLFGDASFNEERRNHYKQQLSSASKLKQKGLKIDFNYNLYENNPAHSERVIELSSKTNQFNINKQAINGAQLEKYTVFTWDCETQYGPLGVVGFALISNEKKLINFAMSCRALGFRLEYAVFDVINSKCGIQSIMFKKTEKNKVAQDFLKTIEEIPLQEIKR